MTRSTGEDSRGAAFQPERLSGARRRADSGLGSRGRLRRKRSPSETEERVWRGTPPTRWRGAPIGSRY